MIALAIGSGSPVMGALVLFAFVLGTSPLFFILGYSASKLGENMHKKFMKVAAIALILLALINLNAAIALTGSSWTFENLIQQTNDTDKTKSMPAKEKVTIQVLNNGYNPNVVTAQAGKEITFTIVNNDVYTCASAFTIPYYNYQKVIEAGKAESVTLKMPDEPTEITFMCSMGMYRGVINVIK